MWANINPPEDCIVAGKLGQDQSSCTPLCLPGKIFYLSIVDVSRMLGLGDKGKDLKLPRESLRNW